MRSNTRQRFTRTLFLELLEDRRVLDADFSGNSLVDAPDLNIWKTNFGTVGTATFAQGDANGDMNVDGSDFLVWQRNAGRIITPTAPSINVILNGVAESLEESTGAIVFRNSDFSKESLAMNQPEAGLPLYVPDYAAPASVFDPNAADDFTPAAIAIATCDGWDSPDTFHLQRRAY